METLDVRQEHRICLQSCVLSMVDLNAAPVGPISSPRPPTGNLRYHRGPLGGLAAHWQEVSQLLFLDALICCT